MINLYIDYIFIFSISFADLSKSDFNESKLKKVYKDSQTNHELVRHLISTILNTSCENLAISLDSLFKVIEFNKNVLMKLFEGNT